MMVTSLLAIPIMAIGISEPFKEIPIEKMLWGSSPASFEALLPDTLNSVTAKEIHLYSNGFGTLKYKFTARVFNSKGIAYVLFGGKKSNQLIGLSWKSKSSKDCQDINLQLYKTLGEPTEVFEPLQTITWEQVIPDLEVTFKDFSSSCSLLLLPDNPFIYD
jgi:hypothetical protein